MGARNRRMRRIRRQCSSLGEAQRQIRPTVRVALLRRRTRATQHTPYVERPKRSLRFLTSVVARRPWRRLRKVRPRDKHDVSLNWILPRAPDQQQLHVVPRANTRYTTAPTELRERIQRANHNACTAARGTSPTERGAQGEAARARPGVRTGPPGRSASDARDIIPCRSAKTRASQASSDAAEKHRSRRRPDRTSLLSRTPAPPREREAHPTCCAPEQLRQHRARAGPLLHSRRDAHLADAECLSCSAREVAKRGDTLSE